MVPDNLDSETLLSVMRDSDGYICLVVQNIGATVYVRWNPSCKQYEWLSVSGPARTILMYETVSEADLTDIIGSRTPPQIPENPIRYAETPFPDMPTIADEYEEKTYSLDGGIRVECACGASSMVYTDKEPADNWVTRHHRECEETEHDLTTVPSLSS